MFTSLGIFKILDVSLWQLECNQLQTFETFKQKEIDLK